MLRQFGVEFYDPDEATLAFMASDPSLDLVAANILAWHKGKDLLEKAIAERLAYSFETTLGGNTIPRLLEEAAQKGAEVSIWYVGLIDAELHIQRVRDRVAKGGHDIPERRIRDRFEKGRMNLIKLLPMLARLSVYDNSAEHDPHSGAAPEPRLILRMRYGVIKETGALFEMPQWAKPIVMAAIKLARSSV